MEKRNDKRTREVALYWKSLNPVFKVDLHGDFRSRLDFPEYFCDNLKGRLPRMVTIKGPGPDIDTWEVQVGTSTNTTWLFGQGWKNFVTAFSLEESDTLIFKYKKSFYFKVIVISGKTSCEKESSHFVTISTPGAQVTDGLDFNEKQEHEKEKEKEKEKESDDHDPKLFPFKFEDIINCNMRPPSQITESSGSRSESRKRNAEVVASPETVRAKTENISFPSQTNRQQFTEKIEFARQRAKSIQTFRDNSFFVSLSRSHVSGTRKKLGIPRQWWDMVIKSNKNQYIQLRGQGDDECRSYSCFCVYDKSNNTGTITQGWAKFVQDNALYEHDCCVFKLSKPWKEDEIIFLEVEIIRVE